MSTASFGWWRIWDFPSPTIFPARNFRAGSTIAAISTKTSPRGNEINAHCAGNEVGTGIDYTIFALADTDDQKNPIGIAGDWRIALHELLGHGVLYNHIGNARFKFAHSAGDSFAAILNDPGSKGQGPLRHVSVAGRRRRPAPPQPHGRRRVGLERQDRAQSVRRCAGCAGLQQRADPVVDDVPLLSRHRRRCRCPRRQAICGAHDLPSPAGGHRIADGGDQPDRCRAFRRRAEQGRRRGLAGRRAFPAAPITR